VPGVGLIVAATFVSVIDDARRFKNAHAVGAYLGLVPSETTSCGRAHWLEASPPRWMMASAGRIQERHRPAGTRVQAGRRC